MDRKKSLAAMVGAVTGLAAARVVDLALVGGGLATAIGAVALAGYMMTRGEHAPIVNGVQYLAIFAQPSHPHRDDDAPAPVGVDINPVGAISHDGKDQVAGYQMVGAQQSFAWIREGARIFAVHPGDEVPSLGRIGAIEMRDVAGGPVRQTDDFWRGELGLRRGVSLVRRQNSTGRPRNA
jgi:hypothetical protein